MRTNRSVSNGISLLCAALSIGWMIGMSVSPVVNIIVSSVIVVIISVTSVLSGISQQSEEQKHPYVKSLATLNIFPIAVLCFGLALGAACGIYSRTHNFLGINSGWGTNSTTSESNPHKSHKKNDSIRSATVAGLYSLTIDQCNDLKLWHKNKLRTKLQALPDSDINYLVNNCHTDSCLEIIKQILCANAK